jgi:hypothetical protein
MLLKVVVLIQAISMLRRAIPLLALAIVLLALSDALAEKGPCRPLGGDVMFCGNGAGAVRTFYKTTSPSGRLAFGWRLTDRPPTVVPEENDPNLENIVVRIGDGAILAKSHGSYWDLGTKIARAHVSAAWSPDSHLALKVEQRVGFAAAELFAFLDDDTAIGPFELVDLLKPALLAKMQAAANPTDYGLIFFSHPAITIDAQERIHFVVCTTAQGTDGPRYEATIGVARTGNTLAVNIESLTPYSGAAITIIVH